MQQYQNVLQDKFGNVIVGASVAVYVYGTTTPATIYSGNGTGLLPSNTVTTSSLGEFAFYAANGRYSLSITATNFALENYSDFILYDPADIGAVAASGVAFTPYSTIAATNVQNAIQEVVSDLAGASGSSLVGFLPSGTGTVTTTVQTKLRDISRTVEDFGAVADGTLAGTGTDNTTAINAAITQLSAEAVASNTVATLEFRSGVIYRITNDIQLKTRVSLSCKGIAYLVQSTAAKKGITNATGTRIYAGIEGIVCYMATGLTGTIGLDLTDVTDSFFEGVNEGFPTAVKIYSTASGGAYRNVLTNPIIRAKNGAASIGLDASGTGAGFGANSLRVYGGQIQAIGGTNIQVCGDNINILDVVMEGAAVVGINFLSVLGNRANVVSGCRFENVVTTAIQFGALATENLTVGNAYTSATTNKVLDNNGDNWIAEVSQIFLNKVGKGRYEAGIPVDTAKGVFLANMQSSGQIGYDCRITGDTYPRWQAKSNSRWQFGSGSAVPDVGMIRSASNEMALYSDTSGAAFLLNATVASHQVYVGDSTSTPKLMQGTGSPEGVVTAVRGSQFMRTDGGAGTCLYVKESGTGNTGWVAK